MNAQTKMIGVIVAGLTLSTPAGFAATQQQGQQASQFQSSQKSQGKNQSQQAGIMQKSQQKQGRPFGIFRRRTGTPVCNFSKSWWEKP
jgi:hypothetical protein